MDTILILKNPYKNEVEINYTSTELLDLLSKSLLKSSNLMRKKSELK